MMNFRVTGIIVGVDSIMKDEKYIFLENFMMQSFEDNFHNGRRL